jgi:hypothetical protein
MDGSRVSHFLHVKYGVLMTAAVSDISAFSILLYLNLRACIEYCVEIRFII